MNVYLILGIDKVIYQWYKQAYKITVPTTAVLSEDNFMIKIRYYYPDQFKSTIDFSSVDNDFKPGKTMILKKLMFLSFYIEYSCGPTAMIKGGVNVY